MKSQKLRERWVSIFACTFLFALNACSTVYEAPSSSYVYTTSTQSQHELAGLNIVHKGDYTERVGQLMVLSYSKVDFYIDGRLIASTDIARSLKTFVQLPPGMHELRFQNKGIGVVTLGQTVGLGPVYIFRFSIAEGQIGTFTHDNCEFSNVEFSEEVKEQD